MKRHSHVASSFERAICARLRNNSGVGDTALRSRVLSRVASRVAYVASHVACQDCQTRKKPKAPLPRPDRRNVAGGPGRRPRPG